MTAWRIVGGGGADGGVIVAVRVTPRASREAVEGVVDVGNDRQALAVRVRAAPSDGAANEAVMYIIAQALDLPPRNVTLVSGASSRLKQLRLAGPAEAITLRLAEIAKAEITKDHMG